MTDKPPIGILPRKLHREMRISDLIATIIRHLQADTRVPVEWVVEYNELLAEIVNCEKKP